MKGHLIFRYPGKKAQLFTLGEGEDSLYLCPFVDKKALVLKGKICSYKSDTFPLHSNSKKPYTSSKKEYLQQFEEYIKKFKSESISKAILSRVKSISFESQHIFSAFENMCEKYPDAFCYLLSIEGIGTWAGASPEILLEYKNQKIHTVALAGTKYSSNESDWTEKEFHEHRLVEEYIAGLESEKNKLIEKSETAIVQAGRLYHLKSSFEFSAEKKDVLDFLNRIHPTPAICGLPYEKSKQLIIKTEAHDRDLYSGYIGVVPKDSEVFKMYVNIRCMQVFEDQVYLYIGGGITKDSNGESEWEETERKSATMGDVLSYS